MVIYYWAWGLPLSLIYTPSEISLKKIFFFSFMGSYQLDLASELGLGAPVHFPYACCHISEFICKSDLSYLEQLVSWWVLSLLALTVFQLPLLG